LDDLENAIANEQQALNLTPDDHPVKAGRLSNLGSSFRTRFDQLGQLEDLENAIANHQQALNLTPDDHPDKAMRLSNLGNSFTARFEHLGQLEDLDNAIANEQQALNLTPDGHPDKAITLSNLGISFCTRFEHLGQLDDLENAIANQQQALNLTPDGHPDRAGTLSELGTIFWTRFEHLGQLEDLENAIANQQQALNLTPDGHTEKARRLSNLGSSFRTRFEHLSQLEDLENAIANHQEALNLTPDGHPSKARRLSNLGSSFWIRFKHLGQLDQHKDIENAITVFHEAANNVSSGPSIRYNSALYWALLCSTYKNPSSTLEAYRTLLDIIPQLVWLGHKVATRYQELVKIGRVVNKAVSVALSVGDIALALEWLEEGRSIVWGQILQLRSPIEQLHLHHPELAGNLYSVAHALQNVESSSQMQHFPTGTKKTPQLTAEEEARRHRALAKQYEKLIGEIRQLSGFEYFLQPKKISELVSASRNGPIININIVDTQCDALILHSQDSANPIIHVPLPSFSQARADQLSSQLKLIINTYHVRYDRKMTVAGNDLDDATADLQSILTNLWMWVVSPVLQEIQKELKHISIHHITWCPTGSLAFLPLHAAGLYTQGDYSEPTALFDLVVSSYTPTIAALLQPPAEQIVRTSVGKRLLIVSQPNTPGQKSLPGTKEEVKSIVKCTLPTAVYHLNDKQATVSAVLELMEQHTWVHLACHGIQNSINPLESAFALHDGMLNLKSLMQKSIKGAELAFLSACQTATGDEKLPDEAVHLAAGMLTAGFPSVIGTMWSIWDADAPVVAETFYSILMQEEKSLEGNDGRSKVAYALHEAVKKLREKVGNENFIRWVPFVHFGL
ncbi:hypothetical protein M422DRAFT_151080, partial [Sphaerobolus stellatus SS14]